MIATTVLVLMVALGDTPPTGEQPAHANALANETSPYLLQHRFNPVNWMPWGQAAIERAREEDKPIFLSIGYSTCYWCHVMERESFENEGIAAIINEHFIPIKVDREERPDVDEIYMTGVQVLTGRGGWPISLFLDPHSLRPFAGGTYFPPEARYNKPAFSDLLLQINDEWLTIRPEIDQRARETGERIRSRLSIERAPQAVEKESVDRATAQLLSNYDPTHGGFRRSAPKFPIPVQLEFLLETSMDNEQIHDAVTHTLDRMAMGGMYDQVGGGFHRYSTDAKWLVPHFEKMLYDNGQLATVYAMALEETEDPFYAEVVREILEYVLREMTSPQGGFYSAQDAEVNHREGQNYLWSPEEIRTTLIAAGQPLDVDLVFAAYGLDQPANFRDPHHRDEPPRHVLHLVDRPGRIAATLDLDVEEFNSRLARANTVLLARRDLRDQPTLDDKVLASWNGLMIAGMADGGRVLGDDRYVAAAARAADFVLGEMVNEQGELQRSWREGVAKTDAFLEDHAFMIRGLLALHEATGDPVRLEQAGALADAARERFWNETTGGYYDTRPDQEDLFVRARTLRDSVVPSGNSMMAANLADLAERTSDETYDRDLRAILQYLSPWLGRSPTTTIRATGVLDRLDEELLSSITPAGRTPTADQFMSITTTPDVLELAPGASGRVDVQVKIAPGYHLNAPDQVQEGLYGLEILALGNAVTLQVIYPDPQAWQGPLGDMLVYEGTIEVPVLITRLDAQASTSQMRLVARYQLCNDEVCLQPRAEVLPVRVLMK